MATADITESQIIEAIRRLYTEIAALREERDAALAEVERLKAEIGELSGKWAADMAADLLTGERTVKE